MIAQGVEAWIGAAAGLTLLMVLVSAVLSAAEASLATASRNTLATLGGHGNRAAGVAVGLVDHSRRAAGSLRIGNTIVRVLAVVPGLVLSSRLHGLAGVIYTAAGLAALLVVVAEVLPRALALSRPDRLLLSLAPVIGLSNSLFGPLYRALHAAVGPAANGEAEEERARSRDQDQAAGAIPGAAEAARRNRLGILFELDELEVSDVMVHRTDMRSVSADDPPEAVVREILRSPHTRMPLWRGSLDNIVGVLHAKDLLRALDEVGNDFSKIDLMRVATRPWFVPDTTTLQDQLNAFLRRKAHFAIVVDEYGEVEGLVTLEDIIEEIVGEIADEHDIDVQGVKKEGDGSVVVDGSVPIRDLNRALDWQLPDDEATTIAGLVIHETQSIPEERQAFTFHGKRFVVMKREKNRITRIRIKPLAEAAAGN
ncbi:MAG: HlyC/CorC family transporter [Rhizobiaceae bacterium]|nr:HlyC/CorC family transporter [Rhizobiaceae bacterium]